MPGSPHLNRQWNAAGALSNRLRILVAINFWRSECATTNAPIKIEASVAPKLPGAMQLTQVPTIAGRVML
jgi:hypothetical protein